MASLTHKEKDEVISGLKKRISELESAEKSEFAGTDITGDCAELLAYAFAAVPSSDAVKERRVKTLIKKAIAKL